jgi:hypothetical protein
MIREESSARSTDMPALRRRVKKAPAVAVIVEPSAREEYPKALDLCAVLRDKLEAKRQEELGWKGDRPDAEVVQLIQAKRQAAEALLETGELPPQDAKRKRTFSDILRDRRAIEAAIELNNSRCELLRIRAAGERLVEKQDEVRLIGRMLVDAIITVDRTLRARDELVREIGLPAASLWIEAWPFGRISNTASVPHRLLEVAVANGAMTQAEMDEEVSEARRADAWRG